MAALSTHRHQKFFERYSMNTKMEITGLAQETDFSNPGITNTVLVINGGELRIPILAEAVESVINYAVLKNYPEGSGNDIGGQAEDREEDSYVPDESVETLDESGIAQI